VLYDKLYDQLDTFPHLKNLKVVEHIDRSLEFLDPTVEKCVFLDSNSLRLAITWHYTNSENRDATIDLSSITPRSHIKHLTTQTFLDRDRVMPQLVIPRS
jgi:hypothetical protein